MLSGSLDVAASPWEVTSLQGLLYSKVPCSASVPAVSSVSGPTLRISVAKATPTHSRVPAATAKAYEMVQKQQRYALDQGKADNFLFAPTPAFSLVSGSKLREILSSVDSVSLAQLKVPYILDISPTSCSAGPGSTAASQDIDRKWTLAQPEHLHAPSSSGPSISSGMNHPSQSARARVTKAIAATSTAPVEFRSMAMSQAGSRSLDRVLPMSSKHVRTSVGTSSNMSTGAKSSMVAISSNTLPHPPHPRSGSFRHASAVEASSTTPVGAATGSGTSNDSASPRDNKSTSCSNTSHMQYRMPEGYIVMIVIALLFITSILFYFYMRYRKGRKKDPAAPLTAGPGTGPSEQPSLNPHVSARHSEEKYTTASGHQASHFMPDSGASVNMQPAITDRDSKNAWIQGSPDSAHLQYKTATAGDSRKDAFAPHQTSPLRQELAIRKADSGGRDSTASSSSSLGQNHSYHRNEGIMLHRSSEEASCQAHIVLVPADAQHAIAKGAIEHRGVVGPKAINSANASESVASAPANGQLTPDSIASSRLHDAEPGVEEVPSSQLVDRNGPAPDLQESEREAAFALPQHLSPNSRNHWHDSDGRLLDTSSANPGMASKTNTPPDMSPKPRKLVRDSTKRGKRIQRSVDGKPSPPTKTAVLNSEGSNDSSGPSVPRRPSGSPSLRAMFRSSTLSVRKKNRKSKDTSSSGGSGSGCARLDPPVSAIEDIDDSDQGNESTLAKSIESISESYQFAIRHKPPLGPLRTVEPHVPGLPDELEIKRGNEVFVVGEFADGWVLAINISCNNECGMIPRRCLFFPVAPFMTKEAVLASTSSSTQENAVVAPAADSPAEPSSGKGQQQPLQAS